MPKLFRCCLLVLLALSVTSCAGLNPFQKKLPTVKEIADGTQDAAEDLQELTEEYIFESIQRHNELIEGLREDLDSGKKWVLFAKSEKEKFDTVLEYFEELSSFYGDLVARKDDVREEIGDSIALVREYERSIDQRVANEQAEVQRLAANIRSAPRKYSGSDLETYRRSNEIQIEFAEKRIELLRKFRTDYRKLRPNLQKAEKQVERFIFTITQAEGVYRSAYETLKLQKDLQTVYKTMDRIASLDDFSRDIAKSMNSVEEIVDRIVEQAGQLE